MNENLLGNSMPEEGQASSAIIEVSPEAISSEDVENLGLTVVETPAENELPYANVEIVDDVPENMKSAHPGGRARTYSESGMDAAASAEDREQARREAYAAYGSPESRTVDVEVETEPTNETEAPYVDVEVVRDDVESGAQFAKADVVPEDAEKEAAMKNANPGRWKREAKEEWIAGGGFFGSPVWDWTKKIFGGLLTGLVATATFLGGWIVDLFEGFTEIFTKKPQKK